MSIQWFWEDFSGYRPVRGLAALLFLLFASFNATAKNQPSNSVNLNWQQSEQLIEEATGRRFKSFYDFVFALYDTEEDLFTPEQLSLMSRFVLGEHIVGKDRELLFRLLGLYAQLKYGGEALRILEQLVVIPTFAKLGQPQHASEHIIQIGKEIEDLSNQFGLNFKNIDNRVFEISLPVLRDSGVLIGLHAHADVVPTADEFWVLSDGQTIAPYALSKRADVLYGRGTQDNKNAIVAALIALRVIREENIQLFNRVKLLIDTTEESTATAIPYYLESHPAPDYNIALDGAYPVVIAEKGYGLVKVAFDKPTNPKSDEAQEGTFHLKELTAASAYNQIADRASVRIEGTFSNKQLRLVKRAAKRFRRKQDKPIKIEVLSTENGITVTLQGVSAHSSQPQQGINPLPRLSALIEELSKFLPFEPNAHLAAVHHINHVWGLGYLGEQLGIEFEHPFMGPFTHSVTKVSETENEVVVGINLRVPMGLDLNQLESKIESKFKSSEDFAQLPSTLDIQLDAPMMRDPKGRWLNALLTVASENLDIEAEFRSSSGSTSIHNLPNGVQFGLSLPNEKFTGHTSLEHKSLDQFLIDIRIVTEMIVRLGQMRNLD